MPNLAASLRCPSALVQWWNLNSIFSAPEPLSQFYLSAFLGTLQDQGYAIFVVSCRGRGEQPGQLQVCDG